MHEKEPQELPECKISKFPGGMPPDPPHTIHFVGPQFLYLPWPPPPNPLGGPDSGARWGFDKLKCLLPLYREADPAIKSPQKKEGDYWRFVLKVRGHFQTIFKKLVSLRC